MVKPNVYFLVTYEDVRLQFFVRIKHFLSKIIQISIVIVEFYQNRVSKLLFFLIKYLLLVIKTIALK